MDKSVATQFYRQLLRLYPQEHRDAFGEEMIGVFAQAHAAARQKSTAAVIALFLREVLYLPSSLTQAYMESWRAWRPVLASVPGWPWMAGWAAGTAFSLPLAWLMMLPLTGLLLLPLRLTGMTLGIDAGPLQAVAMVLALGLTVATVQWLFLRRYLPGAGWWVVATLAGCSLAGLILAGGAALVGAFDGSLWATRVGPWIWLVVLPLLGLCWALPQTWLLRRMSSRGNWWVAINVLAFSSILLAGRAFESFLELGLVIALPGTITAGGLRWLLQEAPQRDAVAPVAARSEKRPLLRRPGFVALLLVSLIAICVVAPWLYAVGQLELARSQGVYATVEEGVIARGSTGWGGANVLSVENVYAGPNSKREGMEHVWFGGATVTLDRVPAGGRHDRYQTGSFYIRVHDGWVHVPEGAFPTLVGRLMRIYNVEQVNGG